MEALAATQVIILCVQHHRKTEPRLIRHHSKQNILTSVHLYGKPKHREHRIFSKQRRSDMGLHTGGNQRHGIIAERAQRQQQNRLEKLQSPHGTKAQV